MHKERFEQLLLFLAEAMENGYSYENCLEEARMEFGLANYDLVRIHNIMDNHIWSEDSDYSKFAEDLKNVIIEEEEE